MYNMLIFRLCEVVGKNVQIKIENQVKKIIIIIALKYKSCTCTMAAQNSYFVDRKDGQQQTQY